MKCFDWCFVWFYLVNLKKKKKMFVFMYLLCVSSIECDWLKFNVYMFIVCNFCNKINKK